MNSVRNLTKIGLLLGLAWIVGGGVPGPRNEQVMAFPATAAATGAPKFIEGDQAEARAAAGPNDWVLIGTDEKAGVYVVKNYVTKGSNATNWNELITYMNTLKPDESVADFTNRQKSKSAGLPAARRAAAIKLLSEFELQNQP